MFIRRIKHFQLINNGLELKDKIKLFLLACFFFLPNKIINFNAKTPVKIIKYTKNTRLNINDKIFKLNHPRQLLMVSEQYERNIQSWFNVSGKTFLDVGANIGKYSIKLSSNFKQVHAFEPVQETSKILEYNVKINKIQNIHIHRVAAWDAETDLTFYIKNNPGGNSANMRKNTMKIERIHAERLDCMRDMFGKVDLVKIDVEGAECEALKGMTNIITNDKPTIIIEILEKNEEKIYDFMKRNYYMLTQKHNRNHLFHPARANF